MTFRWESTGLRIEGLTPSTVLPPNSPLTPVLQALVAGDEEVVPKAGVVGVSTARLRSWPDDLLRGLGVTRFTGRLTVEEGGVVGNPRYRWMLGWDGRPGTIEGPWLQRDGARYLLDEAMQEVVALADEVAGQPRVEVFRRIVRLVQLSEKDPRIEPARRLLSRTILEADGVRLTLEEGPDGQPIPVPHLVKRGVDEAEPLPLDAATLERAAAQALRQDSAVALGKDQYLVVTAAAARNATLSLHARRAEPELRRKFVDNPLAFLPDEDAFDEKDYSERVIGVGEAPRRAAAEAPPAARDWAGEAGGLLVQTEGGEFFVPSEEIDAFHDALQGAVEAGAAQVSWDGREVPATQSVLDAVQRVLREAPEGTPTEDGERPKPRVLLIAENEVRLDWAPPPDAVRVVRTLSLPPLMVSLQPHQQDSLRRLQDLWRDGSTGALLCDDMGLGKTLQALVFAAWAADQLRDGHRSDRDAQDGQVDIPVCIVAPPSLLEGWLAEIGHRFEPETFPRVLWGQSQRPSMSPRGLEPLSRFLEGSRGRGTVLEDVRVDFEALRSYRPDVLLIGYDTLRRLQFAVGQIRFGVLVADEAHEVKDPNTLKSRALRAMRYDFGLALTGTPIENIWRDLWTICDFAVPGRLGTLVDFARDYPVRGEIATVGRRLADTLAPVMMRRTRAEALQGLVPCEIVPDRRVMPPAQQLAYQAEVAAYERSTTGILGLLQQLARVSLHPRIRAELRSAAEADAWAEESARTAALWEALRRYQAEGAAVLVFVRSLAMQETLQRALQLSFSLPHVGILNGKLGMPQRHQLVSRLERGTGFRVLLISPDVGGAGWNLQFASRAVLLERPYNPAKEAQMIARIHRFGQKVPVEVVTPVALLPSARSFDETLDELLRDKRELADSVLAPATVSDDEVKVRFRSLLDEPTGDAGGSADETLPRAAEPHPHPPAPGPDASSPPVAAPPLADESVATPPPVPVDQLHPLARALKRAEVFRAKSLDQTDVQRERAIRFVNALLKAPNHAMSRDGFAHAVGIKKRRITGEVAQIGFLNADGYTVIEDDPLSDQVRLHVDRLTTQYGLQP